MVQHRNRCTHHETGCVKQLQYAQRHAQTVGYVVLIFAGCVLKKQLAAMSTDSAAVPWTQLELDEQDSGSGQMQSQPDNCYSPAPYATCSYGEDSAGDPYAVSSTPSALDLMFSGGSQQQNALTPQQHRTWSLYAGHLAMADDHTSIESHFSGIHVGNR